METFFDGEIQGKRRLRIPKSHRDAVFGGEKEFWTTYLAVEGVDLLVMYRKRLFLARLNDKLFPKELSEGTEHVRRLAYSCAEPTMIGKSGHIFLSRSSMADLYGLQDRTGIDSIVGPVKGQNREDFLVVFKPQDLDKYQLIANPQ